MKHAAPPEACDMCHKPIRETFVDGKTTMGPWANMCPSCHRIYGLGLGTGRGQQYARQSDDTFKKTKG